MKLSKEKYTRSAVANNGDIKSAEVNNGNTKSEEVNNEYIRSAVANEKQNIGGVLYHAHGTDTSDTEGCVLPNEIIKGITNAILFFFLMLLRSKYPTNISKYNRTIIPYIL